MSRKYCTT